MTQAWSPWLVALALAFSSACAGATPRPVPRPQVGMGVLDVSSTPTADAVTVVRQQPPLGADEAPSSSTEAPARFELRPGRYRVELWKDGGRYGYDLSLDLQELTRQELEVELRSSKALRVGAAVFTGLGLASTGALAVICASKHNQACGGAGAAAALTGIVGYYAVQAWRHDGRILSSEVTSLGKVAPPPVLRTPAARPPPAVELAPAPGPAARPAPEKAPEPAPVKPVKPLKKKPKKPAAPPAE